MGQWQSLLYWCRPHNINIWKSSLGFPFLLCAPSILSFLCVCPLFLYSALYFGMLLSVYAPICIISMLTTLSLFSSATWERAKRQKTREDKGVGKGLFTYWCSSDVSSPCHQHSRLSCGDSYVFQARKETDRKESQSYKPLRYLVMII